MATSQIYYVVSCFVVALRIFAMRRGNGRRGYQTRRSEGEVPFVNEQPDLAQILGVMATAMTRLADRTEPAAAAPPQAPRVSGLENFRRMRPPPFYGTDVPAVADAWIRQLEKLFAVLLPTEAEKVAWAAFMLEREADVWWRSASRTRDLTMMGVGWTENSFQKEVSLWQ